MTLTDWIQAISTVVLVGITIFYAWQTRRTVNEMRLQRLASKPVLVPDIDFERESYDSIQKKIAQSDFPVAVTNVGTQAAIEIELTLKGPQEKNFTHLPLLLPGATWKSTLTYVSEFEEDGDPILGMPPPEGFYELMVTSKPATFENVQSSEVSLPFELRWSGEYCDYNVKRGGLNIRLQEANRHD